jgi:hypothetical protein
MAPMCDGPLIAIDEQELLRHVSTVSMLGWRWFCALIRGELGASAVGAGSRASGGLPYAPPAGGRGLAVRL